uniref:helix-turn-helix domain-containing protein n=1 Tax=Brucella intermedia TaxID=94625 RepID=UPI002248A666|nr:helix-turn-helix domain-containing protein [Brucella intermedia]
MDERREIARWRIANIFVEAIAEKLGRPRPTIFQELKRNQFNDDEIKDLTGVTARLRIRKRVSGDQGNEGLGYKTSAEIFRQAIVANRHLHE